MNWRGFALICITWILAATADAAGNAVLIENLRRYVAGEPMLSVVDITRGY